MRRWSAQSISLPGPNVGMISAGDREAASEIVEAMYLSPGFCGFVLKTGQIRNSNWPGNLLAF